MSSLNNPTVGSKGLWELKAPFNSLLPVNTALECTAISNYGQLIAIGIDPYETYYKKHEIPEATYKEHMETEGRIVFLRTDSGQRYSFPLHYLVSYPIGTGVNYVSMGIGIRLGALPLNTNLDLLIEQIKELCNLNVGVEIHAETMALSEIHIISNQDHERIKSVRETRKREQTPALAKITELAKRDADKGAKLKIAEEKVIELANKVATLEAEVKQLKAR